MSSQNAYPGPSAGRPAARPTNQERPRQPAWVQPQAQPGHAQPGQTPYPANGWPQQPAPGYQGGFAQPGYGAQPPQQQAPYGQWSELQPAHGGQPGPAGHADPYAPQFEPYVPPAYSHQQAAPAYGAQPAPQWPGRGADPRGFDVGGYAAPSHAPQAMPQPAHGAAAFGGQQYHESELSSADWAGQPGGFGHEPYQQGHGAELGFAQPEGGELDAAYGEEEVEYEDEEPPRGRRPIMIAAALVGAILVGGGVAYGYKKFASLDPQGDPPIIKSEAFPSKIKPADAGGKQFPYSDSKIMGRLGDGTSSAPDSSSATSPAPDASSGASSAPSTDDGGTRKVATLVVGRDGTIQPPPVAPASDPTSSQVGVPGTSLVDVFGGQGASVPPSAPVRNDSASIRPTSKPVTADDMPAPPKKTTITPVKIAKINSAGSSKASAATTGSIAERDDAAAPAPPPAKKPKKVARAETTVSDAETDSAPVTSSGGTGGFVAVLASVPRSASSRMDALKRFADMQQKYGSALAGKTPDVADANLGAKGNYHRLIVGPPGSREQASTVCSQLKSQGYNDCWVTSY